MTITARGLAQLGYKVDTDFILQDDSDGNGPYIKDWFSKDAKPTVSAIEAATKTYDDNYAAKKYQRDREAEYPSIVDQLDDIYHNGIDAWKATIKKTKDKYPKS
tara:strand:+ start:512 stop:823 length:312 start_codon:yes stop_codon:yes gene_type:complete